MTMEYCLLTDEWQVAANTRIYIVIIKYWDYWSDFFSLRPIATK